VEEGTVARKLAPRRAAIVFSLALALLLVGAPPTHAGLIGSGPAATCDLTPSRPFKPWGDNARYLLVGGGSFEQGAPAWALAGGASVVPGNEPFYVNSAADRRSLFLPAGSSATSPTMCFAFSDWHARFFIRNAASGGVLKVDVVVRGLLGIATILDGGSIAASGEWQPSPRVSLLLTNVTSLLGTKAISLRFRAVGSAFQVDDVYLDPWISF
jgi:hypothetical protein